MEKNTANERTELLREMRDLLRVIAEPALAKRDEKLRASLRAIVGRSKPKAEAVFLMDGSMNQAAVGKESGIDQGDLSRLIKELRTERLIVADEKNPKLAITLPRTFFADGKN